MKVPVSVMVSTRNRSVSLARMLNSILNCDRHGLDLELVIVDNGSTDDTAETLASFREQLPIRVLYHAAPGLGGALNRALEDLHGRHAHNRLIIRTDDDVTVDRQWLKAILAGADQHGQNCFFGGSLAPRFEAQTRLSQYLIEDWPDISSPLFCFHEGREGELPPGDLPFGGNMAFYLDQVRSQRFDTAFGVPHALGNETDFLMQLSRAGYIPQYVRESLVHHHIRREQVLYPWMQRRMVLFGRSQARMTWKYFPENIEREMRYSRRICKRYRRKHWIRWPNGLEHKARRLLYIHHKTKHAELRRHARSADI